MTNGKDISTDLITLVCFNKNLSFSHGIKYICELLGLDYYSNLEDEIPESLKITKLIYELNQGNDEQEEDKPLKPISEKILTYYRPYVNDLFYEDGIDYNTQREFEIGYDEESNRITIPIYDDLQTLVGVKGRLFKKEIGEDELKYIYLEPCARSKILYGLYKTYPYIKRKGQCIVTESEKGVLQLWSIGYCNSVGIGGKKISSYQIEKLTRLCVDLIFAFDKDVTKKEIEDIANRFIKGINIYYIFDEHNILDEKESPSDNPQKFEYLYKNCLYKIR